MTRTDRTDIHRPVDFDPADYRVIDYLDGERPEPPFGSVESSMYEVWQLYVQIWEDRIFAHFPDWRTGGGDHQSVFQCNHCGHHGLRWIAVVEHIPTGAKLAFGETCAERVELVGRDAFRAKFVEDRAALELAALERDMARATFENEHADVIEFLSAVGDGGNEFLVSLRDQLATKGELSERQVAAVGEWIAAQHRQDERRQAEQESLAGVAPLSEGRLEIYGEILSTKWKSTPYGDSLKMLVRQADGAKVWGTVPESLHHVGGADGFRSVDKGDKVKFTATVTRSQDDEHFGFFSRPTSAKVVEVARQERQAVLQ